MSTPRSLLDNGADADDDHDVKNDSDDDAHDDDRKPMPMFCLQCKQHSDVTKRSNRNTPLSEPCEYHHHLHITGCLFNPPIVLT